MRYFLLFCFNLCAAIHCTVDVLSDSDFTQFFCAKHSLEQHKKELSEKITNLPYRLKYYFALERGLNLLVAKLMVTSTFDIGGIRRPLSAEIYSIANTEHITINRDQNSFPDFHCKNGLDFCGFLQQFPEIQDIVSRRTAPLNCLISHVGDYIFEDAFRKEITTLGFFKSAPTLMNKTCSIRFAVLYSFIEGLSAYFCLLRGGTFTYKSFKHIFGTIDSSIFATEVVKDYPCFWVNSNNTVHARTCQQRILSFSTNGEHITAVKTSGEEINLEAIWPLVGFSHRIFADVLGISNVQTTMNALDKFTLFHTVQFLVPGDYVRPFGIAERLAGLLNAYDAACEA
jgi:hypothetical protein